MSDDTKRRVVDQLSMTFTQTISTPDLFTLGCLVDALTEHVIDVIKQRARDDVRLAVAPYQQGEVQP